VVPQLRFHPILRVCLAFLLAAVVTTAASAQSAAPPGNDALVTADRLLGVRSGRILRNAQVLVRDGRIAEVAHDGKTIAAAAGIPRHDLGDMTLLPGRAGEASNMMRNRDIRSWATGPERMTASDRERTSAEEGIRARYRR
jgi:hypothetical protein